MSDDAQPSMGLWANMLGLGPLMQTVQDPNFQAHIRLVVQSVLDTNERCKRIEQQMAQINERLAAAGFAPAVLAELGTVGVDGRALAAGAYHNGNGGTAPAHSVVGEHHLPADGTVRPSGGQQ